MNTPALNGNEGVVQDKQEYNESLVRRGKQQHPSKKVKYKYVFRYILLKRNTNAIVLIIIFVACVYICVCV